MSKSSCSGFTLTEVLVAVSIITLSLIFLGRTLAYASRVTADLNKKFKLVNKTESKIAELKALSFEKAYTRETELSHLDGVKFNIKYCKVSNTLIRISITSLYMTKKYRTYIYKSKFFRR